MADELIDIISGENVVTAQIMKSEAHAQGLLHRTILAEIINSQGEWLLVKQAGGRQDAGQYVSPIGGHIKAGETEVRALKREAREEVGYADFPFKRMGDAVWNRNILGRQENHFFILYEIHSDHDPVLNEESVGFRWFSTDALRSEMQSHPDRFGAAWWFAAKMFYAELFSLTK
jgi:isopentenyl-diphosphate Delta-isomerase